ncbi:hypothetical protein CEXT_347461, partial [Caerostris extrusa]
EMGFRMTFFEAAPSENHVSPLTKLMPSSLRIGPLPTAYTTCVVPSYKKGKTYYY